MTHYLSIILFTPAVGALLILLLNKQNENAIKWVANITAFVGFLVSVPLWFWFDPNAADFQFVERAAWIPSVGAEYFLGVDGLSTLLILLTTMMGTIAVLSSWTAITERVKEYYIFLLLLQTGMLPIEIISHLSRVLSLSLRLFGNIFGEDLVILILFSIIPFLVPLPMMFLGLITASLQAFIFVLLTTIYLGGAVASEHEQHEHGEMAAGEV